MFIQLSSCVSFFQDTWPHLPYSMLGSVRSQATLQGSSPALCACVTQAAQKVGDGGENLAAMAKDIARNVAQQAEPKAAELNEKIEAKAAHISKNAEPWSKDVADTVQETAKARSHLQPT